MPICDAYFPLVYNYLVWDKFTFDIWNNHRLLVHKIRRSSDMFLFVSSGLLARRQVLHNNDTKCQNKMALYCFFGGQVSLFFSMRVTRITNQHVALLAYVKIDENKVVEVLYLTTARNGSCNVVKLRDVRRTWLFKHVLNTYFSPNCVFFT